MTYTEEVQLARDTTFIDRVLMAMVECGIAISNEAPSGITQDNYSLDTRRTALAQDVVRRPMDMARNFAYGVASIDTITAGSSDADIKTAVATIWNTYAGINQNLVPPA